MNFQEIKENKRKKSKISEENSENQPPLLPHKINDTIVEKLGDPKPARTPLGETSNLQNKPTRKSSTDGNLNTINAPKATSSIKITNVAESPSKRVEKTQELGLISATEDLLAQNTQQPVGPTTSRNIDEDRRAALNSKDESNN